MICSISGFENTALFTIWIAFTHVDLEIQLCWNQTILCGINGFENTLCGIPNTVMLNSKYDL